MPGRSPECLRLFVDAGSPHHTVFLATLFRRDRGEDRSRGGGGGKTKAKAKGKAAATAPRAGGVTKAKAPPKRKR